jgi:hypothetical protein
MAISRHRRNLFYDAPDALMFGPYVQDNRKLGMVYTPLGAIL